MAFVHPCRGLRNELLFVQLYFLTGREQKKVLFTSCIIMFTVSWMYGGRELPQNGECKSMYFVITFFLHIMCVLVPVGFGSPSHLSSFKLRAVSIWMYLSCN